MKQKKLRANTLGLICILLFAVLSVFFCLLGLRIMLRLGPSSHLLWIPFLGISLSVIPGILTMAKCGRPTRL